MEVKEEGAVRQHLNALINLFRGSRTTQHPVPLGGHTGSAQHCPSRLLAKRKLMNLIKPLDLSTNLQEKRGTEEHDKNNNRILIGQINSAENSTNDTICPTNKFQG